MENDQTINILLVHDNVDEANRMVSLLRNASYDVMPQYAANASELNKRIQERNWELVLAQYSAKSVPAKNIVHQIRRLNKDVPVIFVTDEYNTSEFVDALKMGAADVVPVDEDQLFIQVVARTLSNLEQRRKLRYWQRRFSESEDRFEHLILSSQDGIAIIQEGTYVHVNHAFANYFGYLSPDNMMLMPVFDTIADDGQREFKKYLKPLNAEDAWDTEVIFFDGITADEAIMPTQAMLSQIDFHGEPALQLLIKKDYIANRAHSQGSAEQEITTTPVTATETNVAKIRLQEMVEAINGTIRRAAKTGEDALFFYMVVDHYDETQKQLGLGITEGGLFQLAYFLDSLIPDRVVFGRIREDAFVLIVASNDTERGMTLANRLVREVSSQIFNTGEGSFTCTLSIGITPIGEATASADEALNSCQKTVEELQKPDSSGNYGNTVKLYEPVFDLSSGHVSEADILRIGRQLIKKNHINVVFQPIVSLLGTDDEIFEVQMAVDKEAFAEGEIPPDFIAQVFKTEIGRELDRSAVTHALEKLRQKKLTAPNTKLCFNLSQSTITDDKFAPWLRSTLERTEIQPRDLIFQMREIDVTHHMGDVAKMFERLKGQGVATGLTHYGLAINPATIFNRIRVDFVKVDGSISSKAQKEKPALETLKHLLGDLKTHKNRVIVPYIETASIIPTLWQAGVDFLQGYYIQAPAKEMNFNFSEE